MILNEAGILRTSDSHPLDATVDSPSGCQIVHLLPDIYVVMMSTARTRYITRDEDSTEPKAHSFRCQPFDSVIAIILFLLCQFHRPAQRIAYDCWRPVDECWLENWFWSHCDTSFYYAAINVLRCLIVVNAIHQWCQHRLLLMAIMTEKADIFSAYFSHFGDDVLWRSTNIEISRMPDELSDVFDYHMFIYLRFAIYVPFYVAL